MGAHATLGSARSGQRAREIRHHLPHDGTFVRPSTIFPFRSSVIGHAVQDRSNDAPTPERGDCRRDILIKGRSAADHE